jgi:hypothetical protein
MEPLEQQLDSFDLAERRQALSALCDKVKSGDIELPRAGRFVNMHCHTFFSYNTYGYSPTKFAWLARKAGLAQPARWTSTCSTLWRNSNRRAAGWT